MKDYETVIILSPNLDEKDLDEEMEKVTGTITSFGGEVKEVEKWGKRRFAYEIKRHKEGNYALMKFKSPPSALTELDRRLKLNERVLRHLTLLSVSLPPSEEKKSANANDRV
ncbi:MAG: 30S ribosomal protein S6 [Candidatus Eisenbacteria bacterium]|nr:30S ribosomal protein S6 [Candidatus Eisenbacteria bacterium]